MCIFFTAKLPLNQTAVKLTAPGKPTPKKCYNAWSHEGVCAINFHIHKQLNKEQFILHKEKVYF